MRPMNSTQSTLFPQRPALEGVLTNLSKAGNFVKSVIFASYMALTGGTAGCCVGAGSRQCDGAAAHETKIDFKDGYVPLEEQQSIKESLRKFEKPLRLMNPNLFGKFNGWEITDRFEGAKDGEAKAVYSYCPKVAQLGRQLFGKGHEFCHYASDRFGIYHGGEIASETSIWQGISCYKNGYSLENCFAPMADEIIRGKEEEFAETCSASTYSPGGAIIVASTNSNTLEQAAFSSSVLGLTQEAIQEIRERLKPPKQARVDWQMLPDFLIYPGDAKKIFAMGQGTFGFLSTEGLIRFYVLPQLEEVGKWDHYDVSVRDLEGFNPDGAFSTAYNNGALVIHQEGKLWSYSIMTKRTVSTDQQEPALMNSGEIHFVDNQLTFFTSSNYTIRESERSFKTTFYPPDIQNDLDNADNSARVYGEDNKAYLWVNGILDEKYGKISRLFRMNVNKKGSIDFVKTLELPTPTIETKPIWYRDQWYLHIPHSGVRDYLAEYEGIVTFSAEGFSPSLFIRVASDGRHLEPLLLRYQNNDPSDHGRRRLGSVFAVSGSRLIGSVGDLGLTPVVSLSSFNIVSE